MHPTTADYLAKAHRQDLELEAAKRALAEQVRKHGSDDLPPTRWGIRLPHILRPHLGRRAPGAATA
ncbi:MAG: hypothetical protein U0838_13540 [Chloroflexota bacterium]